MDFIKNLKFYASKNNIHRVKYTISRVYKPEDKLRGFIKKKKGKIFLLRNQRSFTKKDGL